MLYTPATDFKTFCGPYAIAALTGLPVDTVHKMIRRVRSDAARKYGRRNYNRDCLGRLIPIRGTYPGEVLKVLERAGLRKTSRVKGNGVTLRAFMEDRGHLGPALVEVTRHFVTVAHGMICDTSTGHPIPWQEYHKLQRRVRVAWYFARPQNLPSSARISSTTSTTPSAPDGP